MARNGAGELVHPFYNGTQRCLRGGAAIAAAHVATFQGISYLGTGALVTPFM